ncbi:siderophore-interacting protein [Ketogulonicigenium vulgare Y25]|nr:siderophore-interacting protein [Ketogulonicigenium vulgare]ADO42559.1 siderophore-interacting protein [Ketogulonicigenium vulgare Y25]
MSDLHCHAQVLRDDPAAIIPQIRDRLRSYQAVVEHDRAGSFRLSYPFGWLQLGWTDSDMLLEGGAPDPAGLARLKDLMATALRVYARPNPPTVVWQGSLAGDARLESFRLMRVDSTQRITPHMQRVRLSGEDLDRFAAFGAMHVRLQLPTAAGAGSFCNCRQRRCPIRSGRWLAPMAYPCGWTRRASLPRVSIRSASWTLMPVGSISTCCCMTPMAPARIGRVLCNPVMRSA